MYESVAHYQVRYIQELWNAEGHLTQLAELVVWNTKTNQHLNFTFQQSQFTGN